MVVFDLREEAQMISYLYLIGPGAILMALASLAPRVIQDQYPEAFADALPWLTLTLLVLAVILIGLEQDERRQADALAEQCFHKACDIVEGRVSDVQPVHKVDGTGGRYTTPTYMGYFRVGDRFFSHEPRDFSSYSPANALHDGELARVYSVGSVMVFVEVRQ